MKCKLTEVSDIVASLGLRSVGVNNCLKGTSPVLHQYSVSPVMTKVLVRLSYSRSGHAIG